MAFKISKSDQKRIEALMEKFKTQKDAIADKLGELNETRDELRGVIEDIRDEMQGQYDDKSEKWLEGDRASPTEDWISTLSDFLSDIEDEIEMPDTSNIDDKIEEGLTYEPEY